MEYILIFITAIFVNNAYAAYSGQKVDGMSGATEQATDKKEECKGEAATCGGNCEHEHK